MNTPTFGPEQPSRLRLVARLLTFFLMLGCLLPLVAACGISIHQGGNDIVFLRGNDLWAIQPDGTNARLLTSGAITNLAWSPDHHQVLFRLLAKSASHPPTATQALPDAVGSITTIGINGGYPLVLTRGGNGLLHSDAWWNPGGNRLLYREAFAVTPNAPTYFASQSDQPVGIARKPVLDAAGIPVLSADGHQVAVIDGAGNVRLGASAEVGSILASGALLTLPVTNRPAHLLWQPGHSALLYPAAAAGNGVKLVLIGLDGKMQWSLSLPALLDAAFSPDGSLLLVRTPDQFEVFTVGTTAATLFSWSESDSYALPWWASDSNRLLVQAQTGTTFVDIHRHVVQQLITLAPSSGTASQQRTEWRPATTDPWSADGSQFVFAGSAGDQWRGKALPASHGSQHGLYVATLNGDTAGAPLLIDSNNDTLSAWSYPDPSTAFLVGT